MYDDLIEALNQLVETRLSGVNTNMPAKVVSYDAKRNRAVVQPVQPKRIAEGDPLPPPQIVEVPVVFPACGGGKASLTFPLVKGDGVMLAVQQRSLENWLSASDGVPDDPRQFDLSDSVAYAVCTANGTVGHADDVVMKFDKSTVTLKKDNIITVANENATITIAQNGDMTVNSKGKMTFECDGPMALNAGGAMQLKASSIAVNTSARSFTLESHTHIGVESGPSTTGPPQG